MATGKIKESQYQYVQYSEQFKYDKIDQQQIQENWLISNFNIMEYREKLYKAFQGSQQRYIQRKYPLKNQRGIINQKDDLVQLGGSEETSNGLYTVYPKNPNLALQKRKIIKETRGVVSRVIERYFVIDNELITYFSKDKDVQFKKHIALENAKVKVESIHDKNNGQKWHERKSQYRVAMSLNSRNYRPIYYYTNDLNEAKALTIRILTSSNEQKSELQDQIRLISTIEPLMRFYHLWNKFNQVYEKRLLNMISFQLLGINLIEVASTSWFHREKMVKFWSNKILKRQKKPVLVSTFKFGQIKQHKDILNYKSSLLIREQLKRLVNLFKNRKFTRHQEIQKKLDLMSSESDRGIRCTNVQIQSQQKLIKIDQARIKMEDLYSYLQIEEDNSINLEKKEDFFERELPIKFKSEMISYLATDYNPKNIKQSKEFNVRIYGPIIKQLQDENQLNNLAPCEMDLDVQRRIPDRVFQIIIHNIEIPMSKAKLFSNIADIRVKLRQAQKTKDLDNKYFIKSQALRIYYPIENELQKKQTLLIDCQKQPFSLQSIQLDKLCYNDINNAEQFRLDLSITRNNVPIKSIMKELIFEEEIKGDQLFKYTECQKQVAQLKDTKGNQYKIVFSVKNIVLTEEQKNNVQVDYREGNRLLIGRYVLYNQSKPCQVKVLNRDNTLDLMIQTKEFPKIPLHKVTLIEKYGVNMYDLNNLPYSVQNATHLWVIDFQTKNKRLLNLISNGIRIRESQLSYQKKCMLNQQNREYDIEGNLLLSVIEATNLQIKEECHPFVRISLQYNNSNNVKSNNIDLLQFETAQINDSGQFNNPQWFNLENPTGKLFNLGIFRKQIDNDASINLKFQIISKNSNKKETCHGETFIQSYDLINIIQPAQEKCLILEKGQKQIGFLIIQSLFIPKRQTRLKHEIIEDLSIFKSPEQFLHYQYLQKQYEYDSNNFLLPVLHYHPNFVEYSFNIKQKSNFQILNQQEEYLLKHNQNDEEFKSPLLILNSIKPIGDKSSSPYMVWLNNKYSFPDEKFQQLLKILNGFRPALEEAVVVFKHLWRYRGFVQKQETFIELQTKFWQQFLKELQEKEHVSEEKLKSLIKMAIINERSNFENDMELDLASSENSFSQQSIQKHKRNQSQKWFWQKDSTEYLDSIESNSNKVERFSGSQDPNSSLISDQNNKEKFDFRLKQSLLLRNIWDQESSQSYADMFHLIQQGIPDHMRIDIWKDLLGTAFIESIEIKIFQQQKISPLIQYSYDRSKSLYQNYKELVSKYDSLAFRQIDEDIQNFSFSYNFAGNYDEEGYQKRMVVLNRQKRKMRNILRCLMVWSQNKIVNGKITSFSYTRGLLFILQRLVNLSEIMQKKQQQHDQIILKQRKENDQQNEEDCFWILNGIIRPIPRLFSTEISCLEGGRLSVMRNEMTIFKAILRENLPKICDKLRFLGLPVEYLIYDSIGCFYSNQFQSEIVYRLWDIIFYNLSTKNKVDRKRALWYILAPAFLIFREKQEQILYCSTSQQVILVYNNGSSLTYNSDWLIDQLRVMVRDIFVTGAQRFKKVNNEEKGETTDGQQQSTLKMGLSIFNNFINNQKANFSVDKAQLLEQTRQTYEQDLTQIFNSIEQENKSIAKLLNLNNEPLQKQNSQNKNKMFQQSQIQQSKQYLDYFKWRTQIMSKFKKVALKNSGEGVIDELYEFDEPELNINNLDLSKINLFLHQISNLGGVKLFKIKLYYGKLSEKDGIFQSLEFYDSGDVYNALRLQQFYVYDYTEGYNFLKIEILDPSKDDDIIGDLIIDLRKINANRFIKKWFQMRNESFQDNADSFRFPFTSFEISFFLQTHTEQQHNQMMADRNANMSHFINSIKRKLPDRIDIFNKKNETAFVVLMQGDFQRIIQEESDALKSFLPLELANNIINDHYNYISDSDFGNISLNNLQYLVKQCFYPEWVNHLEEVYRLFVKSEFQNDQNQNENKTQELFGIFNSPTKQQDQSANNTGVVAFKSNEKQTTPLKQQQHNSNQNLSVFSQQKQQKIQQNKVPFSLSNFIVSLVLMSHCTLNEKFDILYDIFDWNDGVADGLDMNSIFLLLKTIFERNLYYWPSQELYNIIELSFDKSVSTIYQAFWTRDPNITQIRKAIKLKQLIDNQQYNYFKQQNEVDIQNMLSIDVTEEIQDTLSSYHRMFGTKNVDFNYDSSAFKSFDLLIKNGKELINITNQLQKEQGLSGANKYKLVLFCQVSGERFTFEVQYDQDGFLLKNRELIEKDDLDEYLKRNINKLYLQGRSSGVSKKEFMDSTKSIPFLHDLVRVETFFKDRTQSTIKKKSKLDEEIIVLLRVSNLLLIFRFQSKIMSNVEGQFIKINNKSDEKDFIINQKEEQKQNQNIQYNNNQFGNQEIYTYRILMTGAYEEDTISDLRERIIKTTQKQYDTKNCDKILRETIKKYKILSQILQGTWTFNFRDTIKDLDQRWRQIKEFERLAKFHGVSVDSQIVFKIEKQSGGYRKAESIEIEQNIEKEYASENKLSWTYLENEGGYDCYSLYKHQDGSYEWRLCKIVHKEQIYSQKDLQKNANLQKKVVETQQKFYYWIEFLHLKQMGQKMWLKRKREEILMSSRYSRDLQRNFNQNALKFIQKLYVDNTNRSSSPNHFNKIKSLKQQ